MNVRYLTIIFVLLILAILLPRGLLAQTLPLWVVETVDSNGSIGWGPSLTIDGVGNPHISYFDSTNSSLKYTWHNGTTWQTQTIGHAGLESSLTLDVDGTPYIGYAGYYGDLRYTHYEAFSWQTETIDDNGKLGDFCSLTLDSYGLPHISYQAYVDADEDEPYHRIKYAYYDGMTWHIQRVDFGGMGVSLALAWISHFKNPIECLN